MSAQLAQLQEDRDQYQEQLDLVLTSLHDDPGNEELLMLKEELRSALQIIDDSMAELKPEDSSNKKGISAPSSSSQLPSPLPISSTKQAYIVAPHASSSKAPVAADGDDNSASTAAAAPIIYKVNESILARWVSGDKAFYPARIMSVTGSATAPMYTVKFKSYDTIETLRARDIRPLANSTAAGSGGATKRKADGGGVGGNAEAVAAAAATASSSSTAPLSPTTLTPSGSSTPGAWPPPPPPPSHASFSSQLHGQPPPPPPPPAADAPPAPAATTAPPIFGTRTIDRFNNGIISSAAAQLYPQAAQLQDQQRRGGGGFIGGAAGTNAAGAATGGTPLDADEPPPKKFKKIKATKQLEAGKSKWQEFSSKSKSSKPGGKKDSMFRTPEGIHGRVGFTGSGQTMRKDPTRSRHIYQTNEDLD